MEKNKIIRHNDIRRSISSSIFVFIATITIEFIWFITSLPNKNFVNFIGNISFNKIFNIDLLVSIVVTIYSFLLLSFITQLYVDAYNPYFLKCTFSRFGFILKRGLLLRVLVNIVDLFLQQTFINDNSIILSFLIFLLECIISILIIYWACSFKDDFFTVKSSLKENKINRTKENRKTLFTSKLSLLLLISLVLVSLLYIYFCISSFKKYNYICNKYILPNITLLKSNTFIKNNFYFYLSLSIINNISVIIFGTIFRVKIKIVNPDEIVSNLPKIISRFMVTSFLFYFAIIPIVLFITSFKPVNVNTKNNIGTTMTSKENISSEINYSTINLLGLTYTNLYKIKIYHYSKSEEFIDQTYYTKEKYKHIATSNFENFIKEEAFIDNKNKSNIIFDDTLQNSFLNLSKEYTFDVGFDNLIMSYYYVIYENENGRLKAIKVKDLIKQKEDKRLTKLLECAINEGYFDYVEFGYKYMLKYDKDFILPIIKNYANNNLTANQKIINKNIKTIYMNTFCENILRDKVLY